MPLTSLSSSHCIPCRLFRISCDCILSPPTFFACLSMDSLFLLFLHFAIRCSVHMQMGPITITWCTKCERAREITLSHRVVRSAFRANERIAVHSRVNGSFPMGQTMQFSKLMSERASDDRYLSRQCGNRTHSANRKRCFLQRTQKLFDDYMNTEADVV